MVAATLRGSGELLRPRWLVAALLLCFAGIHLQYVSKITHSENGIRSAFLRWQVQLHDLDDGVNVWEKYAYPNPPIMAILLQPFVQCSPLLGATLWFYAKALLALVAILLVLSLVDEPARPFPLWGKLLAIGMSLRPIEGDLVHGNVNLFILFLIATSLYSFCHRGEYLAGLLLGLSIACKLTPALFIPYFLWKRAWKTLLGAACSLVVFVLLIPGAWFGWGNNLQYLRSWHHQMVAPYAAGIVMSEHKNQSLPGLLHRMLSDEASFSDYVGTQKVVRDTHNLVSWDRATVQGIVLGCLAGFAILSICFCRTSTCSGSRQTSDCGSGSLATSAPGKMGVYLLMAEFSVVILGMLLFCERTWKHHCVTLLIPFSVAAYGVSAPSYSRGLRWYLGITLFACCVLMVCTSSGHLDAQVESQARWGKWAQVYGAYTWVILLLLTSMFVILAQRTKPKNQSPGHSPEFR